MSRIRQRSSYHEDEMPSFFTYTDEEWSKVVEDCKPYKDYEDEFIDLGVSLGHGSFGSVALVRAKIDEMERAVKLVEINDQHKEHSKSQKQMLVAEITAMKRLRTHANVLHLFDTYLNPIDKTKCEIYMVTNYANQNSLYKQMVDIKDPNRRLKALAPKKAKDLIVQIIAALKHCFVNGVVHRDIKLGNILIDYRYNKLFAILSDFGLSQVESKTKDLDTDFMSKPVGYFKYRCPEMLNEDRYSYKCDIWSLGVLIYVMLTATFPYDGSNKHEMQQLVRQPPIYRDDVWKGEDMVMAKLLLQKSILRNEPGNRDPYDEILKDIWFAKK